MKVCVLSLFLVLVVALTTSGIVLGAPENSDCFEVNGSPGCDDQLCEDSVCATDGFCCATTWDQICADLALLDSICLTGQGTCMPVKAENGSVVVICL